MWFLFLIRAYYFVPNHLRFILRPWHGDYLFSKGSRLITIRRRDGLACDFHDTRYHISISLSFSTDVMCYVGVCSYDIIDVSIIYILNIRIYIASIFRSPYRSLPYRIFLCLFSLDLVHIVRPLACQMVKVWLPDPRCPQTPCRITRGRCGRIAKPIVR